MRTKFIGDAAPDKKRLQVASVKVLFGLLVAFVSLEAGQYFTELFQGIIGGIAMSVAICGAIEIWGEFSYARQNGALGQEEHNRRKDDIRVDKGKAI